MCVHRYRTIYDTFHRAAHWISYNKPACLFKRVCVFLNAYGISQKSKTRIFKNNRATNLIMSLALHPTCLKSKLRWSPSKGRSQILDSLPISSGKNLRSGL